MKEERISVSECARRLKVSRAAIHKYFKRGFPQQPDGTIDWKGLQQWLAEFNSPERSGNFHARQQRAAKPTPVPALAALPANATAGDVIARLHGAGMVRLVGVARALGASRPQQHGLVFAAMTW